MLGGQDEARCGGDVFEGMASESAASAISIRTAFSVISTGGYHPKPTKDHEVR